MASNHTYEEYEPAVEWSRSAEADVVKLSLPGFKREDLRVQVDNHGHLRALGERPIGGGRWSRFQKDFQLPANCNADGIRAKFENERLTITLPKSAAPSPPMPMPAPPRRPAHMAAPPQMMPPPPPPQPAVPEPAARPTAPLPPTVPAAPLAPAVPSVKPPAVEPRPSMPRKPYAPAPAPAPAVEQPASTKPQSLLGAVQRPQEEEQMKRERETAGKMAEDRKETLQDQKAMEQQQEAMPGEMALANQPRPASASRALLVNVAVAAVVLLGITVYVWHSLKNAAGGAGEHSHGYSDEM